MIASFFYQDIVSWGYSLNAFVLVVSVDKADAHDIEYAFRTNMVST